MNKPKFRAWDKNEEKWIGIKHLGYYDDGELWYLQSQDENGVDCDPPYFEDDLGVSWDLMQYTGLKDKNGVEIFEGDVVKVSEHPFDNNGNFNGNYEVGWDERDLTYLAGNLLLFRLAPYIEVIGSIHANPELLNEVEK